MEFQLWTCNQYLLSRVQLPNRYSVSRMFLMWIPLFLAFGFVQALADMDLDPELQRTLDVKELELLNKLLSPNDTTLQQETKTLLAHYLVTQALEQEKKRQEMAAGGSAGGGSIASGGDVAVAGTAVAAPDAVVTEREELPTTRAPTTTRAPATTTRRYGSVAVTTTQRTTTTTTQRPRSTPSPDHVLNQVDKILQNVGTGNVIGIVDESLAIGAADPVRNLVNGILTTVFCNPIDRLFNRCRRPASTPNRFG